ncbi:MAG: hypothetical protein WCG43_03740 [Actinomycetes bacterium]|jgi:hypothetical protein
MKKNPFKIHSLLLVTAAFVLIGWIVYLLQALPNSYRATHWNVAWVGYDIAMTATLLTTSWALWKQRQVAIPGAMVSATFLLIDSWFDVITSNPGWDQKVATASAVFVELPAAYLLFRFSRLTVRKSIENAHKKAGKEVVSASLWKTPLMIFNNEE